MDYKAHYFEFLEKAYDGQITVDIKVRYNLGERERQLNNYLTIISVDHDYYISAVTTPTRLT